jgi:hypothetical protein
VEGARHFFGRSAGIHAKGNADVLTVLKRGLPPAQGTERHVRGRHGCPYRPEKRLAPGHFEKLRKTMGLTSSEILAVPSAIIPIEFNYLINPRHPDFSRISVGKPETFHFDKRLLR